MQGVGGPARGPAMKYPEPLVDFQVRLWRLVFSVRCAFLIPVRRQRPVQSSTSPLPELTERLVKSPRELLEREEPETRRPLDHDLRFHRS